MRAVARYTAFLSTLLCCISSTTARSEADDSSEECNSCSIYILDLASFAHTHGYPICDLNNVVVDPTTGVVYLKEKDTGIHNKTSHKYGTHSAPWYLHQVHLSPKFHSGRSFRSFSDCKRPYVLKFLLEFTPHLCIATCKNRDSGLGKPVAAISF